MVNKYFVYEVYEKTDLYNSHFSCYVIFDAFQNKIIQYIGGVNQRAARTNCSNFIDLLSLHNENEPIVIWRNWPLAMWGREINDKAILERIHGREIDM